MDPLLVHSLGLKILNPEWTNRIQTKHKRFCQPIMVKRGFEYSFFTKLPETLRTYTRPTSIHRVSRVHKSNKNISWWGITKRSFFPNNTSSYQIIQRLRSINSSILLIDVTYESSIKSLSIENPYTSSGYINFPFF